MNWPLYLILAVMLYGAWRKFRTWKAAVDKRKALKNIAEVTRTIENVAAYTAQKSAAHTRPAPCPGKTIPNPMREIEETVTVVLRRQIPVRFDEPPRSWLGGLPMMPDNVDWPRSVSSEYPNAGERPLHFAAQVCCKDLPAGLWGGLGPREGWLLLFVDPNQGVDHDASTFRIIHTSELGSEREAPADIGPVHDGEYAGPTYDYLGPDEAVPSTWRRWPVDLVTVPNEARVVDGQTFFAPEDFATVLYEGAPVVKGHSAPSDTEPSTWRYALYILDGLDRTLSDSLQDLSIPDKFIERLSEPGYIDSIITRQRAHLIDTEEKLRRTLAAKKLEDQNERGRSHLAQLQASLKVRTEDDERLSEFIAEHRTPDAMIDYLNQSHHRLGAWREEMRACIAEERRALLDNELDAPIPTKEWHALKLRLNSIKFNSWSSQWFKRGDEKFHIAFAETERRAYHRPSRGTRELMADYYTNPQNAGLIPEAVVPDFEAFWRRLHENRAHRMGGYYDGVQSVPPLGPTELLMLFQVASDDAMTWCWGDLGAFYIFITPDDLENNDYSKANILFECH